MPTATATNKKYLSKAEVERVLFGYDAVEDKGRRRPPRSKLQSEDAVLPSNKRRKIVATTRDVIRNYSTAAWMIRCHLDYVSRFSFQARTGDEKLNKQIEELVKWASRPANFDVAGRFGRAKMIRILEARRVLDGDVFIAKLTNGRIQAIEGDRVRKPTGNLPTGVKQEDFPQGVKIATGGRLKAICISKRGPKGNGFEFERIIQARNIWQHAYWDTTYRLDQVRGITPLAPALNTLQDTYEGISLAMAKAKIAQMFGLIFYRDAVDQAEGWKGTRVPADEEEAEGGESESTTTPEETDRYDVDPGAGPFKLELEQGDKAEMLTTKTPENELLNFLRFTTDLTLKALDIPYSFYDSSKVNYYGQKADIQKYENSAKTKREDNQLLLDRWTAWRLRLLILDGVLELPAGKTIGDLSWEWVPGAMPWIDKLRDLKGDTLALEHNLDSEDRIARRSGQDSREIARERMDYEKWLNDERAKRKLPAIGAAAAAVEPNITDTDKGDDNA